VLDIRAQRVVVERSIVLWLHWLCHVLQARSLSMLSVIVTDGASARIEWVRSTSVQRIHLISAYSLCLSIITTHTYKYY